MRIVISGIPIDVQKKNIKNMHLQVKPPDGHVVISAPLSVDDKAIEASDDDFLRAHWIIYFRYSRKRGDDYIKFLLSKFSSKGIFEKAPVLVETEAESVISDALYEKSSVSWQAGNTG